jgi:cystathionine gamma-lyase
MNIYKSTDMKFSTKAIKEGQEPDPATGATIVPIYQTSTYTQQSIGVHKGYEYSRSGNPTRAAFEKCIAALENGKHGLAFASGLAAEHAVVMLLKPGDHIISSRDLYGGTYRLFEQVFKELGISVTYTSGVDVKEIEDAITSSTKMVWVESPSNPLLNIIDIEAISVICNDRGLLHVVDNTFASPYFQNPLDLGADIIIHSTTKYIGGHSDVVGGVVVVNDEHLFTRLKFLQNAMGGIPGPFDCWLALRGLKTLALRMEKHQENAIFVAEFLARNKNVEDVLYPGLPLHFNHDIARRQMRGFGGMVTFRLKGDINTTRKLLENLKIFNLAESLGGVESLANFPALMTHGSIPKEIREQNGITDNLIRLSVGIEDKDDLIDDLKDAFKSIS